MRTVIARSNIQVRHGFRRGVRRGKVSWFDISSLSLLAGANRRCTSGSPFLFTAGWPVRLRTTSPSRHLCCAPSVGPVPRGARWEAGHRPDSPALPPLHCAALHSDGRKLSRPSGKHRAQTRGRDAPHIGQESNMAARLRPAKASVLRREATPIAEGSSNSPRCFARARPQQ